MLGRSSTIARRLARRASATSTAVRQHSRSTIGTLPPNQPETPTRYADVNQRNFSASAEEAGGSDDSFERMHLVSLLSAIRDEAAMLVNSNYGDDLSRQRANVAMRANARASKADALDLFQAADAAGDFKKYDKVLILMSNGESQDTKFEANWIDKGGDLCDAESSEEYPIDPLLTGKGVGQVLNLSRMTATLCNGKTSLVPELFVVSPLRRSVQTALLAFPYNTPQNNNDWVCHGGLMERTSAKADEIASAHALQSDFPGVDYDTHYQRGRYSFYDQPLEESKTDLLQRTDDFLNWLRGRMERVVVVSSHATWLQSFCGYTLGIKPGLDMFRPGEMRAAAIKF